MAQIQPAQYGDYGKASDEPSGGLTGRSFNSRCPPVVTQDTIIIGVCGPNDYMDNASPCNDGWFFSDFYLFHHVFRGTAKEQHWLTCVSPNELVKKYQEFAHGNTRSDKRRVVLDNSMLKEVDDVVTCAPRDLLDRFLSYVLTASRDIKGTQRPILILVFGHGTRPQFSIPIGGAKIFEKCPTLTREEFREALLRGNPDANATMLMTTCYGGGWVQETSINMTAMAGVDCNTQMLSWPESDSLGRYCGSRYASGIAEALMKREIGGLDLDGNEGDDIEESSTYTILVSVIHDTLTKEVDIREENEISFSAKDDMWGMEYRARTGFPLASYQEKWEALRPLKKDTASEKVHSATVRFSDTTTLSTPQAEYRIKHLAFDHLNSCPGPDEAAKNHRVHRTCRGLLRNESFSKEELELLAGSLRYRLETIIDQATEYKDRLGVSHDDCRNVDTFTYIQRIPRNGHAYSKYRIIKDMVYSEELFDRAAEHEGMRYVKGSNYLSIVFLESGWTLEQIQDGLKGLVQLRGNHGHLCYFDFRVSHRSCS